MRFSCKTIPRTRFVHRQGNAVTELRRRFFIAALGAGGVAVQSPARAVDQPAAPVQTPSAPDVWLALSPAEADFAMVLVNVLIPADDLSPSGSDLGLAVYIDRQLAGAWGAGSRLYRAGPFLPGPPELGDQSPLLPREAVKAGILAADAAIAAQFGKGLAQLPVEAQTRAAHWLEQHQAAFFNQFLALTQEALFADPIYGGNRGKQGWALLGYPGLPALYRKGIARYRGRKYGHAPQSIADFG
jgi:gluconate 2-dehydrogenase gamma chain